VPGTAHPTPQPDLVQTLFNDVSNEIADLQVDQRARIEAALKKIRACIPAPGWQRTEEQLAEGETKYRELFDCITDPCVIYDANLRMVFRNKASIEISRVPPGQAIGKTFEEVYPHLAGGEIHQIYLRALQTGQPQKYLSRWVRTSDQQEFFADLFIYPSSSGGLIAFSKDATERVQTEIALREAHERAVSMARFPDENPNPVARVSRDGKILYNNRASARLAGWQFQPGQQVPGQLSALIEKAMALAKHVEQDVRVGENFYSITCMPFPNEQYANLYAFDITERKQAEEALKASMAEVVNEKNRLVAVMEALPIGLAIYDKNGADLIANHGYEEIWGSPRPPVHSVDDYPAYKAYWADSGQLIQPHEWASAQALQKGETVRGQEIDILGFDGVHRIVLNSGAPIRDAQGDIIGSAVAIMDITERRQMEQALAASERKYRELIQYAPTAIYEIDFQTGLFTSVNDSMVDLSGYSREELLHMKASDLLVDESKVLFQARVRQWLGGEEPYKNVEYRVKAKDGHTIYAVLEPTFTKDEQGKPLGATVIGYDVTERKLAEEALAKAYAALVNERNRLLAVMEALPIGMSILDKQGGVSQTNKGFEAVWGGPLPQINSIADYKPYQAWWAETGQPVQPEEWASTQAVQKGVTVTGQFLQIQRFDGRRAFVLNSGAPTRDVNGKITGSAVAIMDITQWIEAENALQESQNRFRVALSMVPIMVYTCDQELRYTWVYQPLRGFQPEEVIGKRDDELLPAETVAELMAVKRLALETGQGGIHEVNIPINGQNTYYILTIDPLRDPQGNISGLTCSAIDITDKKRQEAEQQEQAIQIEVQKRLMDHREQDRSTVARDLHDGPIQTLASILFHFQMIKEVFPDPALQSELNQIGMDVKNTIQELREVMNELRPPALLSFGFSKVIPLFLEDFRSRYPFIEVEFEVTGDDKRLSSQTNLALFRIFQAGINNIIRHSGAKKVWVVYKVDQDSFYFELRDNGKGFELTRDLVQLTREGHFGLVGMRERAEAIGGEFSVSSEAGSGTTIVVKGADKKT
jgi:PAS domain S-box-containing protein